MEFLLHSPTTNTYKLYHSLRRLCKDNGLDPDMINKEMLPVSTPKGLIISLRPDTRA